MNAKLLKRKIVSRRPKCLNRRHCSNLIEHHVSSMKVTQSLLNKSGKTRHFQCSIDSSKHNYVIGRSKVEVLVLTLTRRTKPSLSGNTSVIRPIGHTFLVVESSTITMSPTVKFLLGRNHFWRSCNEGRYSRFQRPQNTFAKYCT